MKTGTKSLLFGVHQIFLHPAFVFIAWCKLYGLPNWKETICIFIHDLGYWGCDDMDGECGSNHPYLGAKIAGKLFGKEYYELCLYHSRGTAKKHGVEPSRLCWCDKLSCRYDPWWIYIPRAVASGEIKEYRKLADKYGECKMDASNRDWYKWGSERMIKKALSKDVTPAYD